jgi:hypothetical protein
VRHNNEVFSAFRTHRMQNDIARQLLDSKGQLKSYEQFRRDVEPLTGKYCDQWLNTEYNTAVIRAHRAADWKHFETEKDVYPNLRWMPTTSAEPDPVHMKFWSSRLTLPVDDPFWDHHHPGERWGCKCTCEQTDEPVNDLGVHEDIPDTASKGLHGNPGQTGQLFSEDHPYYPKNCGSCPFTKGAKNRMRLFLNKDKDCASCQACTLALQKATGAEKQQKLLGLIKKADINRPTGEVIKLDRLSEQDRRKIQTYLSVNLVSDIISVSDRRILHSLRPSKVSGGRAVERKEFINELLNINSLEIFAEQNSANTLLFVRRHGDYFNKYVFRVNSMKFNGEIPCLELVTAGRVNIRQLNAYIKIK